MTKKKDPKDLEKRGRPVEWTPEKLKKLGKELIAHVQRKDVFHISHFECIEKDHCPGWLKNIVDRHPKFRTVLKKAQVILGNKIITQAMIEGGDRWVINTLTPMYMEDIRKRQDTERIQEKDENLERQKNLEEFKKNLGEASQEVVKPKIDEMIEKMNVAYENKKLREEIKRLKGEE